MKEVEDKNTRYYIDLDLETSQIIGCDYGQREELALEKVEKPRVRIYITKGQFNKLQNG